MDNPEYYTFGLKNAVVSYDYIAERRTPAPTRLEQLMNTFELYDRMVERGIPVDDFDIEELLSIIKLRVQRQLDGQFYPEVAMYMQNPQRVLGSFMMRWENFRIRIDDTQHNVISFYYYQKNYDKMVGYGLKEVAIREQ